MKSALLGVLLVFSAFALNANAQIVYCSEPYETDCQTMWTWETSCGEQLCWDMDENYNLKCGSEAADVRIVGGPEKKYHLGLMVISQSGIQGATDYTVGTTDCTESRQCEVGVLCIQAADDLYYCKSDTSHLWVGSGELFLTPVLGTNCEVVEEPYPN